MRHRVWIQALSCSHRREYVQNKTWNYFYLPLKHWIHFLLSSLWPPTSNMLLKSHRMLYHLCALGKITRSMHSTRVQFKNLTAPRTGAVKYCLKRREICWCCTACQRQLHCSTCPALPGEGHWTHKMRNTLFKDKCWPFQSTAVHMACNTVLWTRTSFRIFLIIVFTSSHTQPYYGAPLIHITNKSSFCQVWGNFTRTHGQRATKPNQTTKNHPLPA